MASDRISVELSNAIVAARDARIKLHDMGKGGSLLAVRLREISKQLNAAWWLHMSDLKEASHAE